MRLPERARQWHRQYQRTVLDRDAADVARVRDTDELGRLVEIVALRSASLLNLSALGAELGMRRLAEQCGEDFQGGMILYAGASTLPSADRRILAVPLSEPWRNENLASCPVTVVKLSALTPH